MKRTEFPDETEDRIAMDEARALIRIMFPWIYDAPEGAEKETMTRIQRKLVDTVYQKYRRVRLANVPMDQVASEVGAELQRIVLEECPHD